MSWICESIDAKTCQHITNQTEKLFARQEHISLSHRPNSVEAEIGREKESVCVFMCVCVWERGKKGKKTTLFTLCIGGYKFCVLTHIHI